MNDNKLQERYGTVSETINALTNIGYTLDFNLQEECLVCKISGTVLAPEDFKIDKAYRFEGASDPEDQAIIYAISSPKFNVKGILVDGYGTTSDSVSAKMIEKLRTHSS